MAEPSADQKAEAAEAHTQQDSDAQDEEQHKSTAAPVVVALKAQGICKQLTAHRDTAPDPSVLAPNTNFWRYCVWTADGLHALAAQDDSVLQVLQLPQRLRDICNATDSASAADDIQHQVSAQPAPDVDIHTSNAQDVAMDALPIAQRIPQSESIYSCAGYPLFHAEEAASACVAVSCRGQPVHLWDALTGQQRCTYRTYDNADEVATAHSLCFAPQGDRLWAGLSNTVVSWDVTRPGRQHDTIHTKSAACQQKGIISTLAMPAAGDIIAAGSFSGMVGIYDARRGEAHARLAGHTGGVTHVQFSRCGNFVYSGARHDSRILCWDVRYTRECLYCLNGHAAATAQRIGFDIELCGRLLFAGGADGCVRVYNLADGSLEREIQIAHDTVSGVSVHPSLPLLLTASGHRRFADASDSSSSDSKVSAQEAFLQRGDDGGVVVPVKRRRLQWQPQAGCNELAVWQLESEVLPEQDLQENAVEAGGTEGAKHSQDALQEAQPTAQPTAQPDATPARAVNTCAGQFDDAPEPAEADTTQ